MNFTESQLKAELDILRDGQMTSDMVFRDPYLRDFLGLQGAFSEKDLETPSCARWKDSCWNWGAAFPSWPARSG